MLIDMHVIFFYCVRIFFSFYKLWGCDTPHASQDAPVWLQCQIRYFIKILKHKLPSSPPYNWLLIFLQHSFPHCFNLLDSWSLSPILPEFQLVVGSEEIVWDWTKSNAFFTLSGTWLAIMFGPMAIFSKSFLSPWITSNVDFDFLKVKYRGKSIFRLQNAMHKTRAPESNRDDRIYWLIMTIYVKMFWVLICII